MIDLEAITITNESRARKTQLEIMPRNVKALTKFVKSLKEINPSAQFVFQLTHSGEISEPEFSRRVTVKPVYGLGGDLLTEEEVETHYRPVRRSSQDHPGCRSGWRGYEVLPRLSRQPDPASI